MWRRKDEGLALERTAKGKKWVSKFMLGITYGKAIVECHIYTRQLNRKLFSQYIKDL